MRIDTDEERSGLGLLRDAKELWASQSIGVHATAQSDRGDLEAVVRAATNGKGADLALNGVGGSIFGPLLGALAPGGRIVVYSAVGGREFALDILPFYRKQLKLFGLDTQPLNASHCAHILTEIGPLFESGALKPPVIGEVPALRGCRGVRPCSRGNGRKDCSSAPEWRRVSRLRLAPQKQCGRKLRRAPR